MKGNLFEGYNLSPQEVRDTLESLCVGRKDMNFFKPITTEEMALEKDNLSQHAIRRQDAERRKKAAMDEFNEEIKALNKHFDETLEVIKTGGVNVDEEVYDVPNYDSRSIDTYDSNGGWITSRPMTPDERQRNLGQDLSYAASVLSKPRETPPPADQEPAEQGPE